ncbi:MAG: exonuclease domain-containing protein [Candidatus Promineifilaceae bacterium]
MSIVFFDLETGGLDGTRHPIVQIGAIAVDAQFNELERYEALVKFKLTGADPEALQMNSYDPDRWAAEGQDPRIVARDFMAFLVNC